LWGLHLQIDHVKENESGSLVELDDESSKFSISVDGMIIGVVAGGDQSVKIIFNHLSERSNSGEEGSFVNSLKEFI